MKNNTNLFGWGYIIPEFNIGQVEGKLLTLIEGMGLKDTQERAIKGLVRQTLWEIVSNSVNLSSEDHLEACEKYKGRAGKSLPAHQS